MSQPASRVRIEIVGAGVAILGVVLPILVQIGQAIGLYLSSNQLRALFIAAAASFVLGVLIILYGIGALRFLRHLRSPITLRSPVRPSENALGDGTPPGVIARYPINDSSVNWPMEYRKQQHEITMLQAELREWGNDAIARRMLKRARAEFPNLSVAFVNDLAGLLHAAYQKPRTNFPVEFESHDNGKTGYIGVPDIKRSLTLPYAEALLLVDRFRHVIADVQNESINDAKRPQP